MFLCFEWGITPKELGEIPNYQVERFYEARSAKADGEERKRVQDENLAKIKNNG